MLEQVIVLHKKEGETPLEALENFRRKNSEYKDAKMTYAGRLDPLVSGLLVILAGESVKEKEKYLGLTKEYEFRVLFGFSTDTFDILGKVLKYKDLDISKKELEEGIKKNMKYFRGKFIQKYPLYSSKTIKHARAGRVVEISQHEVEVQSFKFIKINAISGAELLKSNKARINKVQGDFRQKDIIKLWEKYLHTHAKQKFQVASFKVSCSSGTYVRAIANDLGERIGIPALALKIKRTKIGKWAK